MVTTTHGPRAIVLLLMNQLSSVTTAADGGQREHRMYHSPFEEH